MVFAHQRDAARPAGIGRQRALDLCADPFRPGPGLARTTSAHDHPGAPVAFGRHLVIQRPELEQVRQRQQGAGAQFIQKRFLHFGRRASEPFGIGSPLARSQS